jgi:hypothetical protein
MTESPGAVGANADRTPDPESPIDAIAHMVDHVLDLASTWTAWDGRALIRDGRAYTPHKAIRRTADHMVDHLAQLEAHLAGEPSLPDRWLASTVTTHADLAAFTDADFNEAENRLRRLAEMWRIRLQQVAPDDMDRADDGAYTPRQMARCAADSAYYADAVGRLRDREEMAHGSSSVTTG